MQSGGQVECIVIGGNVEVELWQEYDPFRTFNLLQWKDPMLMLVSSCSPLAAHF